MTIRPYRPQDLERLQTITIESFDGVSIDRNIERRFGFVAGRDWRERKAHDVTLDCEVCPEGVFVAEVDGEVAGYVTARPNKFTRIGRIPNLAVDPRHRSAGLGSALIRHAMEWLQERGMAMAKIETLEQNARGQSLYPRFGFEEVARQIHYVAPLTPRPVPPGDEDPEVGV